MIDPGIAQLTTVPNVQVPLGPTLSDVGRYTSIIDFGNAQSGDSFTIRVYSRLDASRAELLAREWPWVFGDAPLSEGNPWASAGGAMRFTIEQTAGSARVLYFKIVKN